jgi:hypothetical protein
MRDLCIELEDRPGALADIGEALARAGVSIEGGGAWRCGAHSIAHFLFEDGAAARSALVSAGIRVIKESDVLVQRLNQDQPGQLGDHAGQLILVVDDMAKGRAISEAWTREQARQAVHPSGREHA